MTEMPELQRLPEFDLADRMRKALRESGIGVQEMADYLGVKRNAVGTWINGRVTPPGPALKLFALRTGVPLEWIRNGATTAPRPGGPGEASGIVRHQGLEPRTRWFTADRRSGVDRRALVALAA